MRAPARTGSTTLNAAGVPCGSVRSLDEVFADPQIAARAMALDIAHPALGQVRVLGTPLKLSETPASIRMPPPGLGEHTGAVLSGDLGLSREDIDALRAKGVV